MYIKEIKNPNPLSRVLCNGSENGLVLQSIAFFLVCDLPVFIIIIVRCLKIKAKAIRGHDNYYYSAAPAPPLQDSLYKNTNQHWCQKIQLQNILVCLRYKYLSNTVQMKYYKTTIQIQNKYKRVISGGTALSFPHLNCPFLLSPCGPTPSPLIVTKEL